MITINSIKKLEELDWECVNENTTYLTHNIHTYHSKYIPQIAGNLIKFLSKENDTVLDNFCGSGTTLIEAKLLNRNAIGIDINPLACLISKSKTTPISEKELKATVDKLLEESMAEINSTRMQKALNNFNRNAKNSQGYKMMEFHYINGWFQPQVIKELSIIKNNIEKIDNKDIQDFCLMVFSSIIREVSNASSEFGNLMISKKKRKVDNTFERFEKKINNATKRLLDFSKTTNNCKINVVNGDTRKLDFVENNQIDLIVTHPPYIAAVPYAEYQKLSLRWLGFSDKELNNVIIGGKRQSNDVVERFNRDMQKVFDEMYRVLKPEGYCCVVIGNPVVKGKRIKLNKIFVDMANESGFNFITEIVRGKYHTTMGKMKEEFILIFRKSE